MNDFEKLGAFYLGRVVDSDSGAIRPDPLLYDANDLTTHAVCVGMTGSGKTGLCLALIEEAAIDGIPVLAIDPKGDLGNLLLTFPELRAEDFAPWLDPGEAARKGRTPEQHADAVAAEWQRGLAEWGQDGARIARLRAAADFAIYTPGSTAGLPLTVLRSLAAPPPALLGDTEALAERVAGVVAGLLGLLGIAADPLRSREHILLANLVLHAWRDGRDLQIADLIRAIQTPPFERIGVFDLESFFPVGERFGLAMQLNNLLASPGFSSWMDGEALDVQRLLWTPAGQPRVSVLSIAHLSDAQRMFFVTILLNEVVAWMRTQSGTSSLRALLYMDEVFGYFPPTANPPSKQPMLTLLKQGRAFGLGCVLATQNPVDLDYKGLSNAGTWFLGRLQTERDKLRVLDGLEGASAATGARFDRARLEATLAGLDSRVFLMNDVHEDAPVLFHTRWVMSYLRGPMTRDQIATLMAGRKRAPVDRQRARPPATGRPALPPGIEERFLAVDRVLPPDERVRYCPALYASVRLHYVSQKHGLDAWVELGLLARLDSGSGASADPFGGATELDPARVRFDATPLAGASFAELPADAAREKSYTGWQRSLRDALHRSRPAVLASCTELGATGELGEGEGDFRARVELLAREARDRGLAQLRDRYAPKIARLEERMRKAQQRVEKEQAEYRQQRVGSVLSFGTTLLGALFGRKKLGAGTVSRAATSIRSAGRASRAQDDVEDAREDLAVVERQLAELDAELRRESEELRVRAEAVRLSIERVEIAPRKADLDVARPLLVWAPWRVDAAGALAAPLFDRG